MATTYKLKEKVLGFYFKGLGENGYDLEVTPEKEEGWGYADGDDIQRALTIINGIPNGFEWEKEVA